MTDVLLKKCVVKGDTMSCELNGIPIVISNLPKNFKLSEE